MSDENTTAKTQVEKDREWLETTYKGDVPQLTFRAVFTGVLLGLIMALANLYVGLKSGWGIGVEITAIVLSFAIWKAIQGMRLTKTPFGMMENTIVMTSAVAPSYIVSAGLVSSIPAIMMLDPDFSITWWQLGLWMVSILFLGLMVSIPIKRQVVNTGELRFPAVIPAAETIKSMYSKGSEAVRKAMSLGIAAVIGIVNQLLMHRGTIPALMTPPTKIAGINLAKLTLSFEPSLLFVGIGPFLGTRVAVAMIVGMVLNYAVLGPWMIHQKEIVHAAPELESAEFLEFPLSVPEGSTLVFELEEATTGPELESGSETITLTKTWSDSVPTVYNSLDELVTDLNAAGETNTLSPNLFFRIDEVNHKIDEEIYKPIPFLPFETARPILEKREKLAVSAPEKIHWEARLGLVSGETDVAALFGFEPGGEQVQTVGGFRNIVAWTMWPGVGMMVVAGLLAFAFLWKSIAGAFAAVFKGWRRKGGADNDDPVAHTEIPISWFMVGFVVFGIMSIILMKWLFQIPVWMGIIAVIMSFFLAMVSIRVSGETGIIPIGAMGKVTQLTFGVLHPGSIKTNLMTAAVTAGAAGAASDMTNSLKVGHLVGAKARYQFIAQMIGIVMAIAVIPVFFIMVPDSSALGTQELPAPAAIVWAGVARLLSQGLSTLPPTAVWFLLYGSLFGAAITLLEKFFPSLKSKVWLPSPAALGMAMIIPAQYSISMFIGAMGALIMSKAAKKANEMYTIPVASGFVAGESLTGVFFAIMAALGG